MRMVSSSRPCRATYSPSSTLGHAGPDSYPPPSCGRRTFTVWLGVVHESRNRNLSQHLAGDRRAVVALPCLDVGRGEPTLDHADSHVHVVGPSADRDPGVCVHEQVVAESHLCGVVQVDLG